MRTFWIILEGPTLRDKCPYKIQKSCHRYRENYMKAELEIE